MATPGLVWEVTRNCSRYRNKARDIKRPFSREALNLKGTYTPHWSFFAQNKGFAIRPTREDKGIMLVQKKAKQYRLNQSLNRMVIKGNKNQKVYQTIMDFCKGHSFTRSDMMAGLRRASVILKMQDKKNTKKPKRSPKGKPAKNKKNP